MIYTVKMEIHKTVERSPDKTTVMVTAAGCVGYALRAV